MSLSKNGQAQAIFKTRKRTELSVKCSTKFQAKGLSLVLYLLTCMQASPNNFFLEGGTAKVQTKDVLQGGPIGDIILWADSMKISS